ncbi:MAG: HAMP domain-containing histidine kinase, partial [Calditrichia bacterium]|nr:HAMP domain-containing histidine kinase [Calditrichia bacterium]
HEIRNPLGIIKGSANILKKKSEDTETTKLVKFIEDEINRLNGLINQFLQFVKVPKLEPHVLNINDILNEILPNYNRQYPDIKFTNNISDREVIGDKNSLIQIIINILNNAVQALQHAKIEMPEIKIFEIHDKKNITLMIENNGPEIPPKTLKKIFEPFFSTKDQGSGLGLPICKILMLAMNGDILIENSTVKNGVKVSLILRKSK